MSGKLPVSAAVTDKIQFAPVLPRRLLTTSLLERHRVNFPHTSGRNKTVSFCTHCHRLQTTAQAGSFKRRSRRFEDKLLDNLDSTPADPRLREPEPASQTNLAQPASQKEPVRPRSNTARQKQPIQPQKLEDDSNKATASGDWGWGYTGPTLATLGSDYEEELQAPARSNAARSARKQPTGTQDNWGQEEEVQDWEDAEQRLEDDLSEDDAPDVTLLNNTDVEQLLKLVPQQQQIQYYGGTPVDFGVRVGTSLVVTLAASKIPLLAAGTLFYPLWWPIYKAWAQNQKIRQYRYVGLWRTKLLDLKADSRPGMMRSNSYPSSLTFLIGNESSARTQISVPFNDRYEEIQVGESAELLLLSNTEDFSSFKALKEAYLPESGIWIAKYPFVDRDVFLDISLDIARSDQLLE